ncbi:hypothetical protein F5Y10DRAFT_239265 [Nemania abortiva]|nr:hypothetical protein F5Y10DRAFT_239265 [Nemania abortiva]
MKFLYGLLHGFFLRKTLPSSYGFPRSRRTDYLIPSRNHRPATGHATSLNSLSYLIASRLAARVYVFTHTVK